VKVKQSDAAEGHSDAEAQAIAQKLLAELKGGADFAALAKKSSEDTGSAAQGGDLGCFGPGRMVPERNAAFALEPGQTSELVRSPFGYHIIRLVSKQEESIPPLSQVKDPVRQALLRQRVSILAGEKAQAAADALAKGGSLEEAARAQGLQVQKSGAFARGEAPPPLSAPVVARAFEMKVGELEKEPFSAGRGGFLFVALAEIQPSRIPELKEVEDKVKADLVAAAAREKARALLLELKAAAASTGLERVAARGWSGKETLSWGVTASPSAILEAAASRRPRTAFPRRPRNPCARRRAALLRVPRRSPMRRPREVTGVSPRRCAGSEAGAFQAYMGQARSASSKRDPRRSASSRADEIPCRGDGLCGQQRWCTSSSGRPMTSWWWTSRGSSRPASGTRYSGRPSTSSWRRTGRRSS
jgi:parvulin-like peptidyl-prolyl isomerase